MLEPIEIRIPRVITVDVRSLRIALIPVLFVCMSIFGSTILNNGGSGWLTLLMLFGALGYGAYLFFVLDEIDDTAIAIGIYFLALSFLLMTSLRGSYITGHDIQREYMMFDLTKTNGLWLVSTLKDAYNACLSITVLPTMLSNLMQVKDVNVFKELFQIFFALVPSIIFLTVRRYTTRFVAVVSIFYFIAFPTFFGDMAFLNRQEIALLFVALMTFVLFDERLPIPLRQFLFILFGIGTVLSHYSTTYIVLAILIGVVIGRPLSRLIARIIHRSRIGAHSSFRLLSHEHEREAPLISFALLSILLGCSFFWSTILTDTASNSLYRVVYETVTSVGTTMKEDGKSSDVLYSLFSWKKRDPGELLASYEKNVVAPQRWNASLGTYFDIRTYNAYPIVKAKEDLIPLTPIGTMLTSFGVNVQTINFVTRQSLAKMLQIFLILGLGIALFRRSYTIRTMPTEFVLMSLGNIILIAAIVLLPMLSTEYGILRAFQQALMTAGIFVVFGSLALFSFLGQRRAEWATGALALVFMASTTGVITQLLGGYEPQLHLNNAGSYYNAYYLEATDIAGTAWLAGRMHEEGIQDYQSGLQTNSNLFVAEHAYKVHAEHVIYPGLISRDSYVLLGREQTQKHVASLSYNGDLMTYTYPLQFLDDHKSLVYSNGPVSIYR